MIIRRPASLQKNRGMYFVVEDLSQTSLAQSKEMKLDFVDQCVPWEPLGKPRIKTYGSGHSLEIYRKSHRIQWDSLRIPMESTGSLRFLLGFLWDPNGSLVRKSSGEAIAFALGYAGAYVGFLRIT